MACSELVGKSSTQPNWVFPEWQIVVLIQHTTMDEPLNPLLPVVPVTELVKVDAVRVCRVNVALVMLCGAVMLSYCVLFNAFHSAKFQSQMPYIDWVPVENVALLTSTCGNWRPVAKLIKTRGKPPVKLTDVTVTAVLIGLSNIAVDAENNGVEFAAQWFGIALVRSKRQILPNTSPA